MKQGSEPIKVTMLAGTFALAVTFMISAVQILNTIIGPGKWVAVPTSAISNYVAIMDRFSGQVFYCTPGAGCRDMRQPRPTPPASRQEL